MGSSHDHYILSTTLDPSGHRDALAVQDPSAESGRNTLPRGKDADEVDRVRGADDDRGFGTRLAVAAQGGDGLGVGELLAAEAGDEQAGTLRRRQLGWDAGDGQGVPASGPVDGVEGNRTLLRGRRVVTLLATSAIRARRLAKAIRGDPTGGRGRTGEACGLLAVDQSLGADSQGAAVSSRKA